MVFPPPTVAPLAIVLPTPTLSVPAQNLCFVTEGMIMERTIRAAHILDTRQHFPEVSPYRIRLQKQFSDESGIESTFLGVDEFMHELLISIIESEEIDEDFEGDGGNSGVDIPEEGKQLTMIM